MNSVTRDNVLELWKIPNLQGKCLSTNMKRIKGIMGLSIESDNGGNGDRAL